MRSATDTTAPIVTSFNINPTTANTNSPITASYTVTGNTALKQIGLWRTTDCNDSPNGIITETLHPYYPLTIF